MKTISIPEELHRELVNLKLEEGNKNAAELIKQLVISYRKQKLLKASRIFREAMHRKGLTFKELLKRSRKIREEISDEWFPD